MGKAATDTFSMMVGAEVTIPEGNDIPVFKDVTGVVGIAGAFRGILSVRCGTLTAARIASQMLGVSLDEGAAQKCDAIGEICNIVAGDFKEKIGLGDKCMLSVPTVIEGKDYQIHSRAADDVIELPIMLAWEPLWIALAIRK